MALPARLFSAAGDARVRVIVNDGFRDASAVSPRFRAPGAPPEALIDQPVRKQTIANDALLQLAGRGFDDAGNVLGGRSLRWLLGKRVLGTGSRVSVTGLPAGTQTIRLEVRDRLGRVGTATVQVVIRAGAPQFTVLSAPARVGRSARVVRVRVASALPGKLLVGGRSYAVDRKIRLIAVKVKPGGRRSSSSSV